ncbi:MAG TPA: tetratricopeptide repeat protein, partial [Anaerolineae bacterium]|nr:tetratricopeptide repeat protein [Anaerolineae bacterium]
MYLDRGKQSWSARRKRPPIWRFVLIVVVIAVVAYELNQRTGFLQNPLNPLQPTPTPTRTVLSWLVEAEDAYAQGDLDKASAAYRQIAHLVSIEPPDEEGGLQWKIQVEGLEPDNDEVLAWQARLEALRGHTEEAVKLARAAVALNPSALNLAILGMALDWNSQYDEAIDIGLRAVDMDPNLAEAHAYLAEIYADRGNWRRALEEGRAAVELDERSVVAHRNLGYVLERQGRYKEAIQEYQRASKLHPRLSYIYIGTGRNYLALGEYDKAIEQFQKAIEVSPTSADGYDALGWAYFLGDDPERGIVELKKAIEVDPDYAVA